MSGNLKFYYKNVTSEVIGDENGITREQFAQLAAKTEPVIHSINKDRNNGLTPYRDLPYIQGNLEKAKSLSSQIRRQCDNFVVICAGQAEYGISKFLCSLGNNAPGSPSFSVFDNRDTSLSDKLDAAVERMVFNVIGQDAREVLAICRHLSDRYGDNLQDKLVITTNHPNEEINSFAARNNAAKFNLAAETPGSLNVLSAAGLLCAAVCGIDIDAILAGARAMDYSVGNEEFFRNPAAMYAAITHHYYSRGSCLCSLMPCCEEFNNLCRWNSHIWDQCVKLTGCQHNAVFSPATPYMRLIFDKLNAYNAGQFIYLMEVAASIGAKLFETETPHKPSIENQKHAVFAFAGYENCENFAGQINCSGHWQGESFR